MDSLNKTQLCLWLKYEMCIKLIKKFENNFLIELSKSRFWYSCFLCDQIAQFIGLWASFNAFGNNYFVQISHILREFL